MYIATFFSLAFFSATRAEKDRRLRANDARIVYTGSLAPFKTTTRRRTTTTGTTVIYNARRMQRVYDLLKRFQRCKI